MRVRFEPLHREAEVPPGTTVFDSAVRAGIVLASDCGGRGRCGKCRVTVRGELSPSTRRERALLGADLAHDRLACQAAVRSSLTVFIPDTAPGSERILTEGAHPPVRPEPFVRTVHIAVNRGSLENGRSVCEVAEETLRRAGMAAPTLGLHCLRELTELLARKPGGLTALVAGNEVLALEEGDTTSRLYGLAVDLGTTTVVGYLHDLSSGTCLGIESELNAQAEYGSDVVSRIEHALSAPEALEHVRARALETINGIARRLYAASGLAADRVGLAVVVGNTPMSHLLLGISPRSLSRYPYTPVTKRLLNLSGEEAALAMNPSGRVLFLPLVSGFIGSDTVAVVLATGLHRSRVPKLAIDIGTNGEIVLTDGKSLVACSCAAGPAFEGAHIRCGMRGADGAIDRVDVRGGELCCHVLGDVPAVGICGSGLVDAVAAMLRVGSLSPDGRLRTCANGECAPRAGGSPAQGVDEFRLTGPASGGRRRTVVVTQRDVRELQLAKAALRAGIALLLARLGLEVKDIEEVYLAGAFGNYVRPESAVAIGLLPAFPKARITPVGNAAGGGARMALVSRRIVLEAQRVARRLAYVELAEAPGFQAEFIAAMRYPE